MATHIETRESVDRQPQNLVEMNWDPISRIVGPMEIIPTSRKAPILAQKNGFGR